MHTSEYQCNQFERGPIRSKQWSIIDHSLRSPANKKNEQFHCSHTYFCDFFQRNEMYRWRNIIINAEMYPRYSVAVDVGLFAPMLARIVFVISSDVCGVATRYWNGVRSDFIYIEANVLQQKCLSTPCQYDASHR